MDGQSGRVHATGHVDGAAPDVVLRLASNLLGAGYAPAGIVAVDARILLLLLLHVDGMYGRSGGDVGEGNFDRVLDRVQELDDHVRHVAGCLRIRCPVLRLVLE